MGICSRRHFLLTICSLQLLTTIERQIFDFLGFMWAPILVNFFNIIFVILGFFGAFQYRPKYIISYCVWNTLWLGWNVFAICFYLNVGTLDKKSDTLNFGTGSFSWWQTNGPGCKIVNEITEPEIYRPTRPSNVTDCVLSYEVIEVMHASTQCILALLAIVGGICLSRVFLEEDDSFDFVGGDDFGLAGHTPLHPMYVSYSALPPPVYPATNPEKKSTNRAILPESQRSFAMPGDTGISTGNAKFVVVTVDDDSSMLALKKVQNSTSPRYSPVATPGTRRSRFHGGKKAPTNRTRVFTDHVRERPLRSFYSDPRLSRETRSEEKTRDDHNDTRPLSLYGNNF